MEKLTLNIKDKSRMHFLMELLGQFDFIEIEKKAPQRSSAAYDFFASSGLWKDRDIDAEQLREAAWKRS